MRKTAWVLWCLVCLAPFVQAQKENAGIPVKSTITAVTVFTDRAQVTRTGSRTLTKGEHVLVFDELPGNLEKNSIQVSGSGNAVLRDVKYRQAPQEKVPEGKLKALYREQQRLGDKITDVDDLINHARSEKSFIENITRKLTGKTDKSTSDELDPENWIKMVTFYRTRMDALDKEIREVERQQRTLQDSLGSIQEQIRELEEIQGRTRNQIEVVVQAKAEGKITLNLSYLVYGPRWHPLYDIRVSTADKKLDLTYNAVVQQQTGEDWEQVELKLSTAQAQISGIQPKLSPWYVNFYQPQPEVYSSRARMSAKKREAPLAQMMEATSVSEDAEVMPPSEPEMEVIQAEVESKATSVVFSITGKSDVKSDNEEHRVTVMIKEFPAVFRYSAVPKLAPYAYLKAQVKNETEFPFLPGRSNVFLDNNFVANSFLDFVAPTEEFWTFLGVDEGMAVEHKFIRKYEKKEGVISKQTKIIYEYLITIQNNKKTAEEIVVWDQVPISGNKEIKVELIKPAYEQDTPQLKMNAHRFLEWYFKPEPGQKIEIPFEFSVEYPKGRQVTGL